MKKKKLNGGNKAGFKKVFRNKDTLDEMLNLAQEGVSYVKLAEKYRVHHTSIMYRCRKAGIREMPITAGIFGSRGVNASESVLIKLRKDIISMILDEKMLVEEVADAYEVSVDVIIGYLNRSGLKLKDLYEQAHIKVQSWYFTEDGAPLWRDDQIEGKICLGKTQVAREKEMRTRAKMERKKIRKELLEY